MRRVWLRWIGAGLVVGSVGCSDGGGDEEPQGAEGVQSPPSDQTMSPVGSAPAAQNPAPAQPPTALDPSKPSDPPLTPQPPAANPPASDPVIPPPTVLALLAPASDCGDLLTRIQNDAIAKLKMEVELAKKSNPTTMVTGGVTKRDAGASSGGLAVPEAVDADPTEEATASDGSGDDDDSSSESASGASSATKNAGARSSGPVAASDTNKQVEDVDEADFVKVVENGQGIFLLHGAALYKLKSWPPAETQLVGTPFEIEGSPSEMFVTDDGKAVVFSSVWGYPSGVGGKVGPRDAPIGCSRGGLCGGGQTLKVTVADVTGAQARLERELYFEGWYVSSRRYAAGDRDVVRTVVQANSKYSGLYQPQVQWYDPWGRPYDAQNIAAQLDEWEKRTLAAIRSTQLSDWIPSSYEARGADLVELAPDCDSYFVPEAGLSDYGLTHVVSLDVTDASTPVGGVTIVGASSTVYSSANALVLAQPDYRTSRRDFGIASEQQTALHLFELSAADTKYVASGWVFGHLPQHNPQFGIDVANDTIRVATTGWARSMPDAKPETPEFWQQSTRNYVSAAQVQNGKLVVVGKSAALGHENESVQSARFVGDRAYVVTFRQTDPLIVVDAKDPTALPVLGEIEIPGFSQYMHPLDDTHLITLGQSATRGIQLQLFDVTNPAQIPAPNVLDFGSETYSEGSYNHKAFTLFEGVLAIPLSGYSVRANRQSYLSGLELVRVDATRGFTYLGNIDHARLYAQNGAGVSCGVCDTSGCYDYACGYAPEVRRGHFVRGEGGTYVYSFSHAGVLVHELLPERVGRRLASVGLPTPVRGVSGPWYGEDASPAPVTDGGSAPLRPMAVDAGVILVP